MSNHFVMSKIEDSELIINPDGSVFHLHVKPGEVGDLIILVGDPERVKSISSHFDTIDLQVSNREFVTHTGRIGNKKVTAIGTGIGTDNIDIVLNELDALVNIDFETRQVKKTLKKLDIVRIGTSGSLQESIPVDSWLISEKSIGFDGLLNFYGNRDSVCDLSFEASFVEDIQWNPKLTMPYVCDAAPTLLNKLNGSEFITGVTISAPGFYGPQGRVLRLPIADASINEKITAFSYNKYKITNYEMECSAIYGLSRLMGHNSLTVCLIIANRLAGTFSSNYRDEMEKLIKFVLNKLV